MNPSSDVKLKANTFKADILKEMREPHLITSTNSVGRKLELARQMKNFKSVGEDLVALIADELVTSGATPLFMTNVIEVGADVPERVAAITSGINKGSQKAGISILAEKSDGTFDQGREDELILSGAATGVVEAHLILGSHRVKDGDVIVAMPSSGIHTAGFALVNEIVATQELDIYRNYDFSQPLGEVLLTPSEIYTLDCLALIKAQQENIRAFSHITSGGLAENTARVIPESLVAIYDRSTWSLPLEMKFLADMASLPQAELESTWNAGIGMSAIVDPTVADLIVRSLAARGMKAWIAGKVEKAGQMGAPRAYLVSDYS
jgi:phosphoribosylformylglycinamidine cyclo-ligase